MELRVMVQGEFPMDAKKDGVIVLPVNLQGLTSLTDIGRRFKYEFPKIHKQYLQDCYYGTCYAGGCKIYEERGFRVALMFFKNHEVGTYTKSEGADRQGVQFDACLKKLFELMADIENPVYYSVPIPFQQCQATIKNGRGRWVTLEE